MTDSARKEQKRQDEKRLEEMLLEGIASGSRVIDSQEWGKIKGRILYSIQKKNTT